VPKKIKEGLTFDDVLVIPAHSQVLPNEVDLTAFLTHSIMLKSPLISAAMDTVTEAPMAIAMACHGGLGVIHKNMSPKLQAREVKKVKLWKNGFITNPVTLKDSNTLKDAKKKRKESGISSYPVLDKNNKLVGLIGSDHFDFYNDDDILKNIMIKGADLRTGKEGVSLEEAQTLLMKYNVKKLPVINKKGHLVSMVTLADIKKTQEYPSMLIDNDGQLRVGAAVGTGEDTLKRLDLLVKAGVDIIFIDTAHGHSQGVLDCIKKIRKKYPDLPLVGGNIATGAAALALKNVGVNAVKVGIGPGSICTTRIIAGIGMPQITAIMDVAEALKGTDIKIIADGGIKQTGDIVKAIAAGADCVMAGSLFAGTDEAPGETMMLGGRKMKSYRGMGSLAAMQKGSKDRYFQDSNDAKKLVPEGIEGAVDHKGSLATVLHNNLGGLRAGMGYAGAATVSELKKAEFVKITGAGLHESHPHGVTITTEAPNYITK